MSKPFKLRSGNSTSFKMMGSTSPVKHGKFEDFQYGKKGHNPDTMSAKHEDFHAKQSGKSPIEKKVDLTKKTGLGPRVKESEVDHMTTTTLQQVLHNKHADKTEGTIGEQKKRGKTN